MNIILKFKYFYLYTWKYFLMKRKAMKWKQILPLNVPHILNQPSIVKWCRKEDALIAIAKCIRYNNSLFYLFLITNLLIKASKLIWDWYNAQIATNGVFHSKIDSKLWANFLKCLYFTFKPYKELKKKRRKMLCSILEGNHEIWISRWFWIWKNTKNKKIKIIISIHNINSLVSFRYMEIQKDIDTLMASIQLVHCGKDNGFDLMMKSVLGLMKIKLWVCHHICFSIRGRPLILCTLWKQMAMMSRKWLSRFIKEQIGSVLLVMIKELIFKKNQTINNQLPLLEKTNQCHIRSSNPETPR